MNTDRSSRELLEQLRRDEIVRQEMLNERRRAVGLPPVQWDADEREAFDEGDT